MANESRLIALHGWGMAPTVFRAPVSQLGSQFDLLTPALPGYPGSPWSAQPGFRQQVALMAAELPAGHLLGWSLGGLYALQLCLDFPEQFSGLTLVCFNPCFVKREDWYCAVEREVFDAFEGDLQRGWSFTMRRFLALQLLGQPDAKALVRSLLAALEADGEPSAAVLRSGLELLRQTDCRASLFAMQQPVQMIFADQDQLVPVDCAAQIGQIAPHIQVECVAGAAHLPFVSHAQRFGELLSDCIKQR